MLLYKNIKYPALLLCSVCLSLGAFAATELSSPLSSEESGISKKARIEIPLTVSSLGAVEYVIPTLEQIQEGLAHKAKVLIRELPKAKAALETIEGELVTKARAIQSTHFIRATELAGLVSSAKVLNASAYNTMIFTAKECRDDKDLGMLGIVVIGSSALKQELIQFADILASKDDTKDIDCSVLREVSAQIHEITKDIDSTLQDFPLGDS